ncbi:nucleotide kinase [Enterobacter phage phiEap-1]|uniref:Nucleotide kinase n=1 Tax=Enterobacter phage phiEap-1 TaxID=1587520 RepID=A0A0K2FHE5_9CAUD|nr:nucleotide kinase [Enterobacter phage phiEap-1]ALA45071.1 hypothetical protein RU59_00008 [Enterobacter phage phiEap-1]
MNNSKPILLHQSWCNTIKFGGLCDCGKGNLVTEVPRCPNGAKAIPEVFEPADDGVKQPSHYQLFEGVEAIEVIARSMTKEMFMGYCLGNILKYRLRAGKKSELATLEKDLAKASFYSELYEKHKALCYDAK